jgi:N-acetylmuramoyl-L-alanine amidase
MRFASIALFATLLILFAALSNSSGASLSLEEVRIAGKEYARLADWAKRNEFSLRWLKQDETVELSNFAARIILQIHSPDAQINGVQVRLLFPLIQKGEAVWISSLDLKTTIGPVVFPPTLNRGSALKSICLDPGHGGKDPGSSSQEKKFTLLLAQELQAQLKHAGWKVSLTRSRDTFVELPNRPDLARRRKADLFVSLHFNASGAAASSVQGAEVYCLTPAGAPSTNAGGEGGGSAVFAGNRYNNENMFLAYQVQKMLARRVPVEDRGVHRARFWVLRDAVMPAVLIEAGFLTHPVEARKIATPGYRRQLASAIVEGLASYKSLMERHL